MGKAGSIQEAFKAPNLAPFGLPTPDLLIGIAMSYQIAQKIHGASDPHDPPLYVNRRPRDVVDLVLIKELIETEKTPADTDIKAAIEDIFTARAAEAESLGRTPRSLPVQVIAYPHWADDYTEAATSCGLDMPMDEAVKTVNAWINSLIDS